MTVKELMDELEQINNKEMEVCAVDGETRLQYSIETVSLASEDYNIGKPNRKLVVILGS